MKLSLAISILSATFMAAAAAKKSDNVTYHVISLVPNNQTLGVIVDNATYPLTKIDSNSPLLHSGEAPLSTSGKYQYAILDKTNNNQVLHTENFTRSSINMEKTETLNEYYGRSWNTYNITPLPTVLSPLPVVNRIKSNLHVDGEIPTVHFMGDQSQIDVMHKNQTGVTTVYVNMTYITPNEVKAFQNLSLEVSGHSTRGFNKLAYKFKLDKKDDLYGYRSIKLRAMSTDATYMREELAYGIADSIGMPTTKLSYARVYINDQAIGLFGLSEAMKNVWVTNTFGGGDKKFKQGTLYIADPSMGQKNIFGGDDDDALPPQQNTTANNNQTTAAPAGIDMGNDVAPSITDLSWLGNNVSLYAQGQYSIKEEPYVGTPNYTRLMDVIKFIHEQPTTNVNNSVVPLWKKKIDVDSFLRGLAFEIVTSDSDGYFTLSNNYVLYDDLEKERLVFSGQDFDLTLGTAFFNVSKIHGGDYTDFPGFKQRPLIAPLMAVPQFKQEFEHLLINITKQLVNPNVLGTHIDQLLGMIREDVDWDKSLPKVGDSIWLHKMGDLGNGVNNTIIEKVITAITLDVAINGPTVVSMSMALKEWVSLRSSNLLKFFNESLPATA